MSQFETTGHVHVTFPMPRGALAELRKLPFPVTMYDAGGQQPRESLLRDARGAVALITLLSDRVDDELMRASGGSLRIVSNYAVGYDNIDVVAAHENGVVVTNTPGVLDEATADLTFALILAAARRIVEADRFIREGHSWAWAPDLFVGLDISSGSTLGIVGLGRIGMAVARRAAAFNMTILATGSQAESAVATALGVKPASLDEVLRNSDIVTVHCPLTPSTRHLIGAVELKAMRRNAVLINTARGPIVDEAALVDALARKEIAGAGLDVFENEPAIHPGLIGLDNVVLVPHIGSAGEATREAMALLAVRNVAAVLAGNDALDPILSR